MDMDQFHVAVQQLREKSAKERQNASHTRHEMETNHTHEEDLSARWQKERDAANSTFQQEREERHANRAKITAQYCEFPWIDRYDLLQHTRQVYICILTYTYFWVLAVARIANVSTGREEYAEMIKEAVSIIVCMYIYMKVCYVGI